MKISLIAAMANNGVIGHGQQLPWHLRADLQHFKQLTLNKPVVMGRKTYQSIGKPLPNRTNIILTHKHDFIADKCQVISHPEQITHLDVPEVMIIGGASLYELFFPLADRLYLTLVDAQPEGDTFFPAWDETLWQCSHREQGFRDQHNDHDYQFTTWQRIKP